MTKTSPPQVAFNAGEIDPLLHARFDYQRFQTGMDTCRGFLPLPQGGFTRAPGTTFLGVPKAPGCVLIPFQFAADDAVVLEFTPGIMRVWRYGALVLKPDLSGPYELVTPYVEGDNLQNLRWVQSADAIYIVDGIRLPQRLVRLALNSWSISFHLLRTGPFRVQNLDRDKTILASGNTGTITLTTNFDLFVAPHVGSLMQISPTDNSTIPLWTSNEELRQTRNVFTGVLGTLGTWDAEDAPPVDLPVLRRYGKNVYQLTQGNNAGTNPPIHEDGEALVDNAPTKWLYLYDDIGIVRITAITDARTATANVIRPLSIAVVATPTYRWSEGAFSGVYGYPSSIELFDQRMVYAATPSEPRTVWFSTVGDFADFLPSVEPDGAFGYTVAGSGSQNRITGLAKGRSGLHVFALSEEYSTRSDTRTQVIGPTTATFGLDGSTGAKSGRAIAPHGNPIFITRDGRKVFLITYDFQQDDNRELNLIRASQHIGAVGLEKIVWQQTPEPRAWIMRKTGDLAVMIFEDAEEILGWATHSVRGRIVDLCVTQNAAGTEDQVMLVVERNLVDGPLFTSIEMLDFSHHLMMARVVDLRASTEPSITSLSAPWLANVQVTVESLPPGKDATYVEERPIVAPDGTITLPGASRYAIAGVEEVGHEAITLDIQAAARDGNSTGRNKRLHPAVPVMLHQTRGGRAGVIETHGPGGPASTRSSRRLLDPGVGRDSPAAYTGLVEVEIPSGQAKRIQLAFTPEGNKPLTVLGIFPTIQEAGR